MENFPRLRVVARIMDVFATVTLITAMVILAAYAADRKPPFRVLNIDYPTAAPGQPIVFHADVWRDPDRQCNAFMSRSIYHSGNVRADLPDKYFAHADIQRQETKTPGQMAPEIIVPLSAVPGMAAYMSTTLRYECNYAHKWFKPIEMTLIFPFNVVAP